MCLMITDIQSGGVYSQLSNKNSKFDLWPLLCVHLKCALCKCWSQYSKLFKKIDISKTTVYIRPHPAVPEQQITKENYEKLNFHVDKCVFCSKVHLAHKAKQCAIVLISITEHWGENLALSLWSVTYLGHSCLLNMINALLMTLLSQQFRDELGIQQTKRTYVSWHAKPKRQPIQH